MDSGGPEQITVMSDCTKACVCVCTGFRFSRPPALHLMFPSPLPVFFFFPLFLFVPIVSLAFLFPVAFLCSGALAGASWLVVNSCFLQGTEILCVEKKRWDYLSQRYLPIIFMCWCLCSCSTGCLSSLLLRSQTDKQWRCQAVKPKCRYIKCHYLTNGEIITE